MQLYLRRFHNFLREQNSFEWTLEHQSSLMRKEHFSQERSQTHLQIQINPFMPCATSQGSELAHHSYNHIKVQIK